MPHASAITPAALRDWPLPSRRLQAQPWSRPRGGRVVPQSRRRVAGGTRVAARRRRGARDGRSRRRCSSLAIAVPEAAVAGLSDKTGSGPGDADAVLIGPGFDDPDVTKAVVQRMVGGLAKEATVVLDAFALGVLPGLPDVSDRLQDRMILTPNSREAERLLGDDELPDDDGGVAQAIADRYRCRSRIKVSWRARVSRCERWPPAIPGSAPPAAVTSWRAPSRVCLRAARPRIKPRAGARICTLRPAIGWRRGWGGWAFWRES